MELMTKLEREQLEARLKALVENRPNVSQRIAEARALGDLKENGDYHAARETQGMEEAEIRRLSERLANVSVIDETRKSTGVVFVGATVKLRESGKEDVEIFKMVGEFSGTISDDIVEVTPASPMGEALMKAAVGEIVSVRTPRGVKKFEIVEIL
ncbi:MAG: transcription elongation factor GreA [Phycisphaerales bacterium]|nr:transcription elongation factor GreA [Phycisphaerales bacterium]